MAPFGVATVSNGHMSMMATVSFTFRFAPGRSAFRRAVIGAAKILVQIWSWSSPIVSNGVSFSKALQVSTLRVLLLVSASGMTRIELAGTSLVVALLLLAAALKPWVK